MKTAYLVKDRKTGHIIRAGKSGENSAEAAVCKEEIIT